MARCTNPYYTDWVTSLLLHDGRRVFNISSILSLFLVLVFRPTLLTMVLAQHAWLVVVVIRNRWLCGHISQGRFKVWVRGHLDRAVLTEVWRPSWRSGLGQLMVEAPKQGIGLVYAQFASPPAAASFLLGLKLFQALDQFSMTPFYTKIPLLNRLYAQDDKVALVRLAQRGMVVSLWTFVIGFSILAIIGPFGLSWLGAKVTLPPPEIVAVLGAAYFMLRFGAMHLQLYSTTNHIVWHIAGFLLAVGSIVPIIAFSGWESAWVLSIGLLVGSFCYMSYTTFLSHRVYELARILVRKNCVISGLDRFRRIRGIKSFHLTENQ